MPMVYFKEDYNLPRFQRGSNIFSRGGPTFSREGGGSNCLFPIKSHITCVFPGGSEPLAHPPPPLDQCMQYFALKKVSCEKKLSILTPPPWRGGGTLIFSAYAGSDPASTVHKKKKKKKIRNFKHPQKIFEILATPKISQFCTLTLKKDPKLHRNDPQTNPIL